MNYMGLLAISFSVMFAAPFVFAQASADEEGFPLLLSPEALAARLDKVFLVDVRSEGAFRANRIPGAVWLSANEFSETRNGIPNMLPSPETLLDLLSARGIGQHQPVVLYGQNSNAGDVIAVTRVFWALECLGYPQVAILDGGLSRWEAENRELTDAEVAAPLPPAEVRFNPKALRRFAEKSDVLHALDKEDAVLVDARPSDQYSGATPIRGLTRNGHIPGALNIPFSNVLSRPHGVFQPLPELQRILRVEAIPQDKPVIVYCNAGAMSSALYFAYRLCGYDAATMYDGSMFEWAADPELPVSAGAESR